MMRRTVICSLAALLVFSVIGWIVYMPPAAARMLRPVPAHAQIIYQSETPDFSVLERLHFPGGREAAGSFLKTSGKDPLTVAAVALGGRDRRDTWITVRSVGCTASLLRWQLAFAPPEGVKRVRSYGAWPVWQYSSPSLPAWMRVRFSITEGLLVCSISDDSHDIYYLLDTLDGRRPSADRKE